MVQKRLLLRFKIDVEQNEKDTAKSMCYVILILIF